MSKNARCWCNALGGGVIHPQIGKLLDLKEIFYKVIKDKISLKGHFYP